MTRYEYDDDGRMVSSTTQTEPTWSAADYAQMQALAIFEAYLCPGCNRPIDICADDYVTGRAAAVDRHVCSFSMSRAVQERLDAWENADPSKRSANAPMTPEWNDGLLYAPRLATDDEIANGG